MQLWQKTVYSKENVEKHRLEIKEQRQLIVGPSCTITSMLCPCNIV